MTSQDISSSGKILVSMIAYREKYLAESVRDCYEKAEFPERLLFSIVSEQYSSDLHADLSFIPEGQIIYRKFDLSEYRGVLWSRHKTTEVPFEYDYILFTCGHNRFAPSWDTLTMTEYLKAKAHWDKPVITFAAPELFYSDKEEIIIGASRGRLENHWRGKLDSSYVPGYGWSTQRPVPKTEDVIEETYLQYSWVFSDSRYVEEVPLDPTINYHAEEIYMSVKTWCAGWRMYTTPVVMYYHDTVKEYPLEVLSRMSTHRPWADINKDYFWKQSDESLRKLNSLLSGKTPFAKKTDVLAYCNFSGLDKTWCEEIPNYDNIGKKRHAEEFRDLPAFPLY
jgi:hypothetical protein